MILLLPMKDNITLGEINHRFAALPFETRPHMTGLKGTGIVTPKVTLEYIQHQDEQKVLSSIISFWK